MEEERQSALDMGKPVRSFSISTEVNRSNLVDFPKYLKETSEGGRLGVIAAGNFRLLAGEGGKYLVFDSTFYQEQYSATVRLKLDSPLTVDIFSYKGDNKRFAKRLEDYLILSLQFFEEVARKDTVQISFIPGSEATSRILPKQRLFEKLFTGNMLGLILLFFIIFAIIYTVILSFLGPILTPIILLAILLSVMLSVGKMMALRSHWKITRDHPEIVVIRYQMESSMAESFMFRYGGMLQSLKKDIYYHFSYRGKQVDSSDIVNIFTRYGIPAKKEQIIVKKVNLYEKVDRAAKRFNMPTPTIVVTKNLLPNAAATGFSKHLATMLITLGLVIQLDDKEIELIAGHELSHLRSGDPAILFSLFSVEYLLRVFVLAPFIFNFWILYLIFVFWMIFFFAKLLESRADLDAALTLRDPETMATSLKKIGFRKLILDSGFIQGRESSFGDWFAFDPHPPIGFRIRRLENLDLNEIPKNTFVKSVSDVFAGIRRAMKS